MALFQRLFSNKRKGFPDDKSRRTDHAQKTVPPKLDKSKIRLVIYADSDRGRTPYYDSNAISRFEDVEKASVRSAPKPMRGKYCSLGAQKDTTVPQLKQAPKYHFQRLGSEVKVLEEMMFGNVGMAFKGSTLKVHLLRSPPQLMITKVFIPEKPRRESLGEAESDSSSLPGSSADFSSGEFTHLPLRKAKEKYVTSIPVDVPSKDLLSDCSTDDDSGLASFTSSGSLRASFPSPSNSSASSYNSLHRRWMRAQTTAFDGQHRRYDLDRSTTSEATLTRAKRNKLAIAILFGSHDEKDEDSNNLFQSFFFSHFALMEGHVERLRSVIEKAYFNHRNFLPATMEALEVFRNDVWDLYMGPRLQEPVWLSMMSTTTYRTRLCDKFMQEFTSLVAKYDNKNCKFFVSTLLSAVLTQHLAWVATVTPAGGTPSKTYLDKHSAKWVDTLAKTHPYNPLWAQLGDLFGAIGLPLKISRTVVVGRKAEIVKKFLYMLSYFIRCSDVHEASDPDYLGQLISETNFDLSMSPSSSDRTLSEGGGLTDQATSPGLIPLLCRQTSSSSGGGSQTTIGAFGGKGRLSDVSPGSGRVCNCVKKSQSEPCVCHCDRTFLDMHICDTVDGGKSTEQLSACVGGSKAGLSSDFSIDSHLLKSSAESSLVPLSSEDSACFSSVPASSCGPPSNCDIVSDVTDPSHEAMSEIHIYGPNSLPLCSLTSAKVMESPSCESVSSVNKEFDEYNACSSGLPGSSVEPILRSQSFSESKVKSRLSQRLESESSSEDPKSPVKKADVRKMFLSEGSSSMFEEYFEPGVEAKTIDDLHESEKVFLSGSSSVSSKGEGKKDAEISKMSSSRSSVHESKGGQVARPASLVTKCRPITPTELSRRRHLSSTGSIDYEAFDPMIHCKEIKMPAPTLEPAQWNIKAFDRNFGRSLLASYTDHYMSDFVLHGTSDTNFKSRLLNDLQMTVQHSILDEPIDEAVCVIADTDNWTVEVASSKVLGISPSGCTTWTSSQLVADLIESVVEVWRLKMNAEFCLMHLEDRLQEIYFKSRMLSEYMQGATAHSLKDLTSMLGFESSDMPLLVAIAGTHTPSLALGAQ